MPEEQNPEEIFSKTIHDFPNHQVVQLAEDEDTNFVVYSDGVQEFKNTSDKNTLVAADVENSVYTFSNADDSLKNLKKGDIFWMEIEGDIPQTIAIKVKKVEVNGDDVTVYDAIATVEDLFTYVEIDMVTGTDTMYLQNIAEGVDVSYDGAPDIFEDSETTENGETIQDIGNLEEDISPSEEDIEIPPMNLPSTQGLDIIPLANKNQESEIVVSETSPEKDKDINSGDKTVIIDNQDLPRPVTFSTAINISSDDYSASAGFNNWFSVSGNVSAKGRVYYNLRTIDIKYRYSAKDNYYDSSMVVHGESGWNLNFTGSGSISGNLPMAEVVVPIPYCPIIMCCSELYLTVSTTGSISGGWGYSGDVDIGFSASMGGNQPFAARNESEFYEKEKHSNLMDLSGTVDFGPKIKMSLGIRNLAFWQKSSRNLAEFYGTYALPVRFKGEYDPFEDAFTPNPSTKHDCDVCIAGKVSIVGTGSCGARLGIGKEKLAPKEQASIQQGILKGSIDLPGFTLDLADFYLSLVRNGVESPEFDWTKCPHKRYKTDILVSGDLGPVPQAKGKATYPDKRTESFVTDANGNACVYLPNGDNLIEAEKGNMVDKITTTISDQPSSAKLTLEERRDIFVVFDYRYHTYVDLTTDNGRDLAWYTPDKFPSITNAVLTRYPEAVIMERSDFEALRIGPYEDQKRCNDKYGISRGDIVIYIDLLSPFDVYDFYSNGGFYKTRFDGSGIRYAYIEAYVAVETAQEGSVCGWDICYYQEGILGFDIDQQYDTKTSTVNQVLSRHTQRYDTQYSFDSTFKIVQEKITESDETDYVMAEGPIDTYSYLSNSAPYGVQMVEHALDLAFPYIDNLLGEDRSANMPVEDEQTDEEEQTNAEDEEENTDLPDGAEDGNTHIPDEAGEEIVVYDDTNP